MTGVAARRRRRPPAALLTSLLLGLVGPAAAERHAQHLPFRSLSIDDGLSQASVLAIHQDEVGFLWFGTQEGLNRFDGRRFDVFLSDPLDPASLPADIVRAIRPAPDGRLWIGTEGGGLALFDPATGEAERVRLGAAERPGGRTIRALAEDVSGRLWVATQGAGLYRLDPASGAVTAFVHDPDEPGSLGSDEVLCLLARSGTLWIGHAAGLDRLDLASGEIEHVRYLPELAETPPVSALLVDRGGALWIGTLEGGLVQLEPEVGSRRFRHRPDADQTLPSDRVRALLEDAEGNLWVGTDGGLARREPGRDRFQVFRRDPARHRSLVDDRVVSLAQDANGVIWIGTFGGVSRWSPALGDFELYRAGPGEDQLSSPVVTSFATRDQEAWIGTMGGGLHHLDRLTGEMRNYRHDPNDPRSLSDDRVMSLLVDSDGGLWIGTYAGGLARLVDRDAGHFVAHRHDPDDPTSLVADGVTVIEEDGPGHLWVGTYEGGLDRLDVATGRFRHHRHRPDDPTSLAHDAVIDVLEDSRGAVWVATRGGGLNLLVDRVAGSFWRIEAEPDVPGALTSDRVIALLEDRSADLWLATEGGGLLRWPRPLIDEGTPRFEVWRRESGLPGNTIYGLLEDGDGYLWLSSNRGLARFDPQTGALRRFDARDGLQSTEFNSGAYHAAADGTFYFGGNAGFNAFDPVAVRVHRQPPPVVVRGIHGLHRPLESGDTAWELEELELAPADDSVTFEFAALDFVDPERNRFRHRLRGFEETWVDDGTFERATYTNLAPGDYVLEVIAANADGMWSPRPATLAVVVRPPWWATWWARALYASALLGAVGLVAGWQRRKLAHAAEVERYNAELEREIERRRAKERALAREKERAQRYLDVVEVIILALDGEGRVKLINPKGCRVLETEEAEILGRPWLDAFVPADAREEARQALSGDRPDDYGEWPVVTRSGERRLIAWHCAPLCDEAGDSAGVLCSGADVTQLRALEHQVRAREKLDAVGTLASGIAHDFNNILAVVLGYAALAVQDVPAGSEVADNLAQVVKAAERARTLVRRLLTFSHQESQPSAATRVQDELTETLSLFAPSVPANVELESRIDDACPAVRIEPSEIGQVVVNLCTNALYAMRTGGGALRVELDDVDLIAEADDGRLDLPAGRYVRLTVEDSGHGMEPEVVKSIFDPFFTTKPVGVGTGLGLSAVHGIVRRAGGKIRVSSEPGAGTLFEVFLPAHDEEAEAKESEASAGAGPATGVEAARILYVDDEPTVAALVVRMLKREGATVVTCDGADEALRRLGEERFDVLVTDERMPGMSGRELAGEVARRHPALPVVLTSGEAGRLESVGDGSFHAFVAKPFSARDLIAAVREATTARAG